MPRLHPPETPEPARRDWPWRGAYVSYQGLAMPVLRRRHARRINFGSMAEGRVGAVWTGDGYQEFRRRLASEDPPAVYRSCAIYAAGTF